MQATLRVEAIVSSKTLVSSTRLHGVTCKKIELIIIVAVN
jgi:N-acetylmuramic acid 6-phosphate (MurNAc-6-P) etherase